VITQDETGRWSNRAEDVIALEPYDPRWAEQFSAEQHAIRACVHATVPLVIEHIGSTAIPGMPAKPILDILIGAASPDWSAIIEALKGIEYVHWENNPDPEREFLVKGMPPFGVRRTHHVHICAIGGPLWERLLFRDYLLQHPEDRIAYADLKSRLAAEYPDDRDEYTQAKGALVADIMGRARTWRST
jgi:GrpB-like predicted nucleotidyltransferase (UPF0157 family)